MKKIVLAIMLGVAVGLVELGYGQFYEPEHLWHRCGEEAHYAFGNYIAGIGDVNGDGCDDFLTSNRAEVGSSALQGHVLLFYGGNPPDTIPDMVFQNPYPYGHFGRHLENVGDVNGDGSVDFTIQGIYVEDNIDRVFIYYGGTSLDTIPDVVLTELTYEDAFGFTIEGIGDVNGDGYDDVAVQAANYPWPYSRGKVWIYFGGNPMDSIADWQLQGYHHTGQFGKSIAGKGDLNDDGYDDFAIYEWTGYPQGAITNFYIYFGSAVLDTIPDLTIHGENYYPEYDISDPTAMIPNLDGSPYASLIIMAPGTENGLIFKGGNPMDTIPDVVLQGFDPDPPGYDMNVSVVGDVNGDGYDDIIASQTGAYGYGGLVLVYLGSPWMTGQPDMRWQGIMSPWEGCGVSLTDCGDVNGDGVDDIMFGSYQGDFNTEGCVDIWFGSRDFVVNVPPQHSQPQPSSFRLLPPYPNPFNANLTIPFEFSINIQEEFSLKIYNLLGQEVIDLTWEAMRLTTNSTTGIFNVIWEGRDYFGKEVANGVYLVEMRSGSDRQILKVVLLK